MTRMEGDSQQTKYQSPGRSRDWLVEVRRAIKLGIASVALLWTMGIIFYCGSVNQAWLIAGGGVIDAIPLFAVCALSVAVTFLLFRWANRDRPGAENDHLPLTPGAAEMQMREIGSIRRYG